MYAELSWLRQHKQYACQHFRNSSRIVKRHVCKVVAQSVQGVKASDGSSLLTDPALLTPGGGTRGGGLGSCYHLLNGRPHSGLSQRL